MYARGYVTRPGAYELDPSMPLGTAPSQTPVGQTIFGAFSDCAPDRWGRTLIDRAEARAAREEGRTARALGDVDFLLGVRDDLRQGALRFRVDGGPFLAPDDLGVPALTDLPELLDLADAAERDDVSLPDLKRLVRVGSSLGGARPKAHVRHPDGRVAIAKFPSAAYDTWNVMAWAKVALDLAQRAGITVPPSRLLTLAGRHVLVVDRFDRTPAGARVGYVSAMTMLRASDGGQRSYLEIAEAVEERPARAGRDLASCGAACCSTSSSATPTTTCATTASARGGHVVVPRSGVRPEPPAGPRAERAVYVHRLRGRHRNRCPRAVGDADVPAVRRSRFAHPRRGRGRRQRLARGRWAVARPPGGRAYVTGVRRARCGPRRAVAPARCGPGADRTPTATL